MEYPFQQHESCVMVLLLENIDPNGKHMEYRDAQGGVFVKVKKVYHKTGLFGLFNADHNVHAELTDAHDNLLLKTTSYRGETKPDCKVEIHLPDGTLLGTLRDAHYGVDFESADGTVLGKARRPADRPTEPQEVVHIYLDASEQLVGTCERYYPHQSDSLLDFAVYGTTTLGNPEQRVTLTAPVDPLLHTFLFLFPALQHLRYSRSEY